jgi:hypothetical protein
MRIFAIPKTNKTKKMRKNENAFERKVKSGSFSNLVCTKLTHLKTSKADYKRMSSRKRLMSKIIEATAHFEKAMNP